MCLTAILLIALAAVCFADTEQRVKPQFDQDKAHLSVVGIANNAQYRQILNWFDTHEDLAKLKESVHFHAVKAGSAIYDARYKSNIHGLPTIRLQDGDGIVLWEVHGSNIPSDPYHLRDAIYPKTGRGCLLPWRRQMEQKCGPNNCGPREVAPDFEEEEDFNFAPEPEYEQEPEPAGMPVGLIVVLALASFVGGIAGGAIQKFKKDAGIE
jgi:hypothetical protein